MLRFIISEHGQPELPGIDLSGRVVIGSAADAQLRLPAAAARPHHLVIDGGRWRALGDVTVAGAACAEGDEGVLEAATVVGGGGAAGVVIGIGTYRVRVASAPANTAPSPPQRTESLARELVRGLLGDGAAPALAVERGPKAGSRRELLPPDSRLVIGRGDDADWSILDEDLSRCHVEIRRGWDGTTLRDLGSQNGTSIDGEPVTDPVVLRDGARIQIGNVVMVYSDPAERHLAGAVTPVKPRAALPQQRPSALPLIVAAAIAGLALAGLVYILAS